MLSRTPTVRDIRKDPNDLNDLPLMLTELGLGLRVLGLLMLLAAESQGGWRFWGAHS